MTNLLVVDDNDNLRELMKIHLLRAGYQVFDAEDGERALDIIDEVPIHLIIVDIMMPKKDGFELTDELRGANMSIPVLIVTARESLDDKRKGFGLGADDYMVKPVDMDELLLRVDALLRRARIANEHQLVIGNSVLNSDAYSVYANAKTTTLPQKEFLLLFTLLSYPGKIFSRQALMDEIWGYDTDTDPRTVDVHIKRLREKFGNVKEFEIVTVRGLGYKGEVTV